MPGISHAHARQSPEMVSAGSFERAQVLENAGLPPYVRSMLDMGGASGIDMCLRPCTGVFEAQHDCCKRCA